MFLGEIFLLEPCLFPVCTHMQTRLKNSIQWLKLNWFWF